MHKRRALLAAGLAGAVLVPGAGAAAAERPEARQTKGVSSPLEVATTADRLTSALRADGRRTPAGGSDEGALEVLLRPGASGDGAAAVVRAAGGVARSSTARTLSVEVPAADAAEAVRDLQAREDVLSVTPVRERRLSFVPADPSWSEQPYLESIGLPAAWERTRGSADVTIAVVDTGVDVRHPDLRRADGTSKVVATYNAVTGTSAVPDTFGHGTFVAGVAAAATDNVVGVAGAGFATSLMAVKVDDAQGQILSTAVARGIRWAVDRGADVINLSLGSEGLSAAEQGAVAYARSRNVVVVAAAGNDGTTVPSYPAALPGVLAVGATDGDRRAAFSNHGSWVDVGAPGVNLRSTSPTAGSRYYDPGYDTSDGTSFSAPLVAGEVALLAALRPAATEPSLVDAVVRGTTGRYGFAAGRVDVPRALAVLVPVTPTEPVPPVAPVSPGAVRITGAAPARISPNGDGRSDTTVISYSSDLAGEVALTVEDRNGATVAGPVALGARPAGAGTVSWAGRGAADQVLPDGQYSARIHVTGDDGVPSTSAPLTVTVDRAAPGLSALTGSAAVFYPVRDGYGDSFAPTMAVAEPLSALELRIVDSAGRQVQVVRSGARPAGRVSLAWDGRRADGRPAPAGSYRFSFRAVDLAHNERVTGQYGVTVSGKRLVARTATRTVTPAASRERLLVGGCSAIGSPATGTCWAGSYEYLSAWYRGCYRDTDDLAAAVHRFTLPPAVRYGNVNVSAHGKSYPGYADVGVLLYHDRNGNPTDTGRVLMPGAGDYRTASVPITPWVDASRTFRWSVATTDMNWYQVKSFTITWSYYLLA